MLQCTSLTAAPWIPHYSSGSNGGTYMFMGCNRLAQLSTSLTAWPGGTMNWVSNVSSDGVFYCPEVLGRDENITRGNANCPNKWLVANWDVTDAYTRDMAHCFTRGSYTTAFVYDGQAHVPDMANLKVYDRKTATLLTLGVDYIVNTPAGQDNTSEGSKTVSLSALDVPDGHTGQLDLSYKIVTNNVSACQITAGVSYDNTAPVLTVVQPDSGYTLSEGTDYTVSYISSTATVTVEGIGNYTGVTSLTAQTATSDPGLLFTKHDPDEQADVQISLRRNNNLINDPGLQVKRGSGNWEDMVYDTVYSDASAVYVRSKSTGKMGSNRNNYNYLQAHGASVDLSGNICSLLDRTGVYNRITEGNAFPGLFKNQSKIVDASKAVISGAFANDSCFGMFANCTDLTAAPQCYIAHHGG